jgi:hypothetical protein
MHALPLLAALLALGGPPARVPTADEQRLFDEGTRAFSSGDAAGAEKAWRAGYALGHDPAFLVHIGEAQEKAGAPAQAAASYRAYLQQAPDASDRADIEQRLARLAPATPPAAATPATAAETPADFGSPPAAPAPPSAPAPAPALPAPAVAPRADAEHPTGPPAAEDSGWNRFNVTAVVATAVTVALLGTAGFFAAAAGSDRDDINRLVLFRDPISGAPLPYSSVAAQYAQDMSDGRRDDRIAKGLLIGAGATAAVAALFFVFDANFAPGPAVSLAPAGTGLAAVGGWSWRW